jgi:hypothetical protein
MAVLIEELVGEVVRPVPSAASQVDWSRGWLVEVLGFEEDEEDENMDFGDEDASEDEDFEDDDEFEDDEDEFLEDDEEEGDDLGSDADDDEDDDF